MKNTEEKILSRVARARGGGVEARESIWSDEEYEGGDKTREEALGHQPVVVVSGEALLRVHLPLPPRVLFQKLTTLGVHVPAEAREEVENSCKLGIRAISLPPSKGLRCDRCISASSSRIGFSGTDLTGFVMKVFFVLVSLVEVEVDFSPFFLFLFRLFRLRPRPRLSFDASSPPESESN